VTKPASTTDSKGQQPTTSSSGGRNLLDSSFSLSGDQWDDKNQRKSTRVQQPPGGQSKGLW
jgi:hypothetical protein